MGLHILRETKEQGRDKLAALLKEQLQAGKQVLWLVSGGSNIELECRIAADVAELGVLKAALIDERYGEPGHADSNYQKLVDAGFTGNLTPVLEAGLDISATTEKYAEMLEILLDEADVVIAQLGIGGDGHTAGVLPGSPVVDSKKLVESYQGPDFARITMTLESLRFVDINFVFAYGTDKAETLQRLIHEGVSLAEQPSQIFKELETVYLYNDQVEEGGR